MGMPGSWGGREKVRKLQGSGLLEAVSGGESSHRVRKDVETRGPSPRLQRGGLGWWSLDWRGPRPWKPARERSRAITHHSAGWGPPANPAETSGQRLPHTLTLHRGNPGAEGQPPKMAARGSEVTSSVLNFSGSTDPSFWPSPHKMHVALFARYHSRHFRWFKPSPAHPPTPPELT